MVKNHYNELKTFGVGSDVSVKDWQNYMLQMMQMGFHDCLRLIHFHIGSQITKIRRIQTALREAAQSSISLSALNLS